MSELALDTGDGRIIDLRREPDAAIRLPRGKSGGRYRCCACGKTLIFSGPATPQSGFTPRFRHDGTEPGTDRCSAPATHQADVQADLTVSLDLRDQLVHALPGAAIALQTDPRLAGRRWELPPAIVIRRDDQVVVLELPRRLLTKTTADARRQFVRTVYGEHATHWWFFDRDDAQQYVTAGTVKVRPHGKPDTHHKVRPTAVQRQLVRAGGTVCWITSGTVLIPYGGHPGTYPAHEGEDWSGTMASWAKDWKISHPHPADGAAWWGLVPLPLLALGQHSGFRPAPAFALMTALEKAQHGREAHRRRLAREHAQGPGDAQQPPARVTSPGEAPTAQTPTPVPSRALHPVPARKEHRPIPPRPTLPPPAPFPRVHPQRRRFSWRRLLPLRWQA
ncbi:hypothetical protein [Streptomyces sp. NBC_00687]|uniref:hypothetical protein n=1 Tax=Streptomyces sp. NBC_00687 TaxID=2975807 RepID=UPI0022588185|nr:hypothetical protein [Streptomyces sp. NBC_00687]MCX4920289.1 hypothetical protein [Streptomyces sp. NBC_00687]